MFIKEKEDTNCNSLSLASGFRTHTPLSREVSSVSVPFGPTTLNTRTVENGTQTSFRENNDGGEEN